jgi:hypothetical protein
VSIALFQVCIDGSQVEPVIQWQQYFYNHHVSQEIPEDYLEVVKENGAYLPGNRNEGNPGNGGTYHPEGYQVPGGVAVGRKEGGVIIFSCREAGDYQQDDKISRDDGGCKQCIHRILAKYTNAVMFPSNLWENLPEFVTKGAAGQIASFLYGFWQFSLNVWIYLHNCEPATNRRVNTRNLSR